MHRRQELAHRPERASRPVGGARQPRQPGRPTTATRRRALTTGDHATTMKGEGTPAGQLLRGKDDIAPERRLAGPGARRGGATTRVHRWPGGHRSSAHREALATSRERLPAPRPPPLGPHDDGGRRPKRPAGVHATSSSVECAAATRRRGGSRRPGPAPESRWAITRCLARSPEGWPARQVRWWCLVSACGSSSSSPTAGLTCTSTSWTCRASWSTA